jgi:hypothetical protein
VVISWVSIFSFYLAEGVYFLGNMVWEEEYLEECLDYSRDPSDDQQIWSALGGFLSVFVSDMPFLDSDMVDGDAVVSCPEPSGHAGDLGHGAKFSFWNQR